TTGASGSSSLARTQSSSTSPRTATQEVDTEPMRVAARLFDTSRPDADVLETHISTVAFDGQMVHKRKKDVRFPFVDLSSPERREAICRREVELNRQFSPDVYLGVEEVVDEGGVV